MVEELYKIKTNITVALLLITTILEIVPINPNHFLLMLQKFAKLNMQEQFNDKKAEKPVAVEQQRSILHTLKAKDKTKLF
jgi:hypothetical protein